MDDVSTGVLEKNKEYLKSKDKAKKLYDVSRHIYLHMSKYKKLEDILSSMSNLQPNWCFKIDFQKAKIVSMWAFTLHLVKMSWNTTNVNI